MAIHKSNQIYLAIIVRINFTLSFMRRNNEHASKINNNSEYNEYFMKLSFLVESLRRCSEAYITASSRICSCYYYAWQITKAQKYLLIGISEERFYAKYAEETEALHYHTFSAEECDGLQPADFVLSFFLPGFCGFFSALSEAQLAFRACYE